MIADTLFSKIVTQADDTAVEGTPIEKINHILNTFSSADLIRLLELDEKISILKEQDLTEEKLKVEVAKLNRIKSTIINLIDTQLELFAVRLQNEMFDKGMFESISEIVDIKIKVRTTLMNIFYGQSQPTES
jgi:hypothetical protein